MSLKLYKNSADILSSKAHLEGHRWSSDDYSLLITDKARAYEDPADQTLDFAVEMHVYTPDGDWLAGDHRIKSAKIPPSQTKKRILHLDLLQELQEVGLKRGSYKLVFNFIKNLLGNTENRSIFIKEISPNRKEVWLTLADSLATELVPDDDIQVTLGRQFKQFVQYTNQKYNKGCSNIVLNLGSNNIFKVVNVRIGGVTSNQELGETPLGTGQNIYLKLYDALPTEIVEKQRAWIAQEDKRPWTENVNIYPLEPVITFTEIKGPNFEIDHEHIMQTESDFQSWNDLLDTSTSTTQQIIDKYFSGSLSGINLNVDYSKFENFVKYSSAEERLKNFRYKLQLIEYYDTQLGILSTALGSDSGSVMGNQLINTNRKNQVIGGFDAFERWAYNEPTASIFTHGVTGSTLYAEGYALYPYPKYLQNGNYVAHHSTSSYGETWLNGFISSGSLYDLENVDSLINSIPENILQDANNDQYKLFVNMVGHHYDILYSYIKELTQIHRTEEHPKLGVPGELLYDVAKSMGWQLANGHQAESLWQYKLGKTVSGSYQSTGSMASKSSEDISQEIWRRIINNLPYILKTKGTIRSVHALMNTYGIPKTLLSIREYGGPKADEQVPDFIEDRFSYALHFNQGAQIKIPNRTYTSSLHPGQLVPTLTHQFRFRPGMTSSMLLMSNILSNSEPQWQLAVQHTASYSGSGQYGRLHFAIGSISNVASASCTAYVPIYDGNLWNVQLSIDTTNTASNTNTTYTVHTQQASDYINAKIVHRTSASLTPSENCNDKWAFADETHTIFLGGNSGSGNDLLAVHAALSASFGTPPSSGSSFVVNNETGNAGQFPNVFTGSMQEYRGWLEKINQTTFDIHTLNPTSYVSSLSATGSYDSLIRHYTFGSDTIAIDHSTGGGLIVSSSHPNQEILNTDLNSNSNASASNFNTPIHAHRGNYNILTETYYIDAPSIGGTNINSTKIRIEDQQLIGVLDPMVTAERSRFDYATLDSNRLGLFYSAADQINKDIYNHIGAVSFDNFLGDPAEEFNTSYSDLHKIAHHYWKKFDNKPDINAYIKVFSLFDFSLFTQIKQLIPVRATAATGLLIEPNILERSKVRVMERIGISNPQHEQRINLAVAAMTASTLPLDAVIDPLEPMEANTLPLNTLIAIEYPVTSSTLPLDTLIASEYPITASQEIFSGSIELNGNISQSVNIISHQGTNSLDTAFKGIISVTYSSSIIPSDYKLSNWRHARTVNGIKYSGSNQSIEQPVIVTNYDLGTQVGSNQTAVNYNRGVTASSAIQTIILDQRRSHIYKKKVAHYTPADPVTQHYTMGSFTGNSIHDQTVRYKHSIGYFRKAVTGVVANQTTISPVTARFESIQHENFSGSALIFNCSDTQDKQQRGGEYVTIPRITFSNKFSVAAVLRPASASGEQAVTWAGGTNVLSPGFWIAADGTLVMRTVGGNYNGMMHGSLISNVSSNKISDIGSWPVAQSQESTYHVVYTFDGSGYNSPSGSFTGVATYYLNGKFQHQFISTGSMTGSSQVCYLDSIGAGYNSPGADTAGYSGSIAHVRLYNNHVLSPTEVAQLNKFPHLRANRPQDGREIFTRQYGSVAARDPRSQIGLGSGVRVKNILFSHLPNIGLPTSHSLESADYMDDEFTGITRKRFEGSKLTGPDWNINSLQTSDGGPVVSFTITNPNQLSTKEGNLRVS